MRQSILTLASGKKLQVKVKSIAFAGGISAGISLLNAVLQPAFKKLVPTPLLLRSVTIETISSLVEAKHLKKSVSIPSIALYSLVRITEEWWRVDSKVKQSEEGKFLDDLNAFFGEDKD